MGINEKSVDSSSLISANLISSHCVYRQAVLFSSGPRVDESILTQQTRMIPCFFRIACDVL